VINARKSHAADPKNVERVLQLSKVEAARRQYREAGATFTEGLYAQFRGDNSVVRLFCVAAKLRLSTFAILG
jgi:hypothetical protein